MYSSYLLLAIAQTSLLPERRPEPPLPHPQDTEGSSNLKIESSFLSELDEKCPTTHHPPCSTLRKTTSYCSFTNNTNQGSAPSCDATIYVHADSQSTYKPALQHVNRDAVRTSSDINSPTADLSNMKHVLANMVQMLDHMAEADRSCTTEDEALEREMADLKYRIKRINEDLDLSASWLMHVHVPEVEHKMTLRDERKDQEKRELARERDQWNEQFGRFDDTTTTTGTGPIHTGTCARPMGGMTETLMVGATAGARPLGTATATITSGPGPQTQLRAPLEHRAFSHTRTHQSRPGPMLSPALMKNMTPEERQAFAHAEARRIVALGVTPSALSSPVPGASGLDSSIEAHL
ncbi:hypothetical protein B0H17DRAFT_1202879 [Mycena rosella]|uniref:Uncharacterized protein n=1 Tax=Mycena rosella TaxID=1033263 RepID=A0AAD7GH20_MYCRO|nr:hypothetical protein B0H17DRAFT_1202879 [Mycena rosella]